MNENLDKTAMVVTAHPDDAEWGCSASVAKWTRLGWDVVYVLCTDGSKGTEDRSIPSKELANIREQEQKDAGKILGLKAIEFLESRVKDIIENNYCPVSVENIYGASHDIWQVNVEEDYHEEISE